MVTMSMTSWLVVMVTTMAIIEQGVESISMAMMAKDIEHTEHVLIRHVTPNHIRNRRSADGHQREFYFDIHHSNDQVSRLRLRRMEEKGDHSDDMRVYRVVNNRLQEVTTLNTPGQNGNNTQSSFPRPNDDGFYTDEERVSLFRVRSSRKILTAYDLEGTVIMNNREYIISPNNEYLEVDASERAHRLCRLMKHLDYGFDALHDGNQKTNDRFQSRRARPSRRFPWYAKPYRSPRKKRQSEVNTNFVEVVFYCDFSCYNQFDLHTQQTRSANETVYQTVRDHFTFIAKAMNLRYESITFNVPDQKILISAQNLVVLDRRDLSEFTESNQVDGLVDAQTAILSFRSYIRGGNGVPRADHWMLFTAYDLSVNGNRNTIGIAFLNRICSDSSVSVVEEFFSGTTAQIATHELGHILGAEHDSAYGQCSDDNYNVMAGVAFFPEQGQKLSNPWQFSYCSAQVITDFISGQSGSCLRNRPPRLVTSAEEAGQRFNADLQCQLSQGPTSFFCRGVQKERGADKLCVRMYCYLPDEAPNCIGLVALDGTSCADGKWCQRGQCMPDNNAPRILNGDSCPQGDDPFYGCTKNSCNDTDARYTFCCKTCGEGVTSIRPVKPPPPPRAIPPIPMQTRAPPIRSINQVVVLPPAPPPAKSQFDPLARPIVRINNRPTTTPATTTTTTTTTTTRRPPSAPQQHPVLPPWWRIPAPPPPPPFQSQPGGRNEGGGGRNPAWRQCNTEICRCLARSTSLATCLYRSWFNSGK